MADVETKNLPGAAHLGVMMTTSTIWRNRFDTRDAPYAHVGPAAFLNSFAGPREEIRHRADINALKV